MEEIVIWLAANPYAVVLGLLVSALPVFVSVLKTLYRSATFVVGAVRTGLSAQIKRTGRMHARRAYKVKKLDRLIETCTLRLMHMISLAAAQIILIVVFVVYIAERYEGLVPDPIYSVQSYNVIFVIGIFAVLMINLSLSIFAFQMRSIFSLRHRLLKRAASREMRR